MKINLDMDLPIKAEQIDGHYALDREDRFDVEYIEMGHSSTVIKLIGMSERFNSIHFKFYLHDREIDIYSSGLINKYRWKNLKMIEFMEGQNNEI